MLEINKYREEEKGGKRKKLNKNKQIFIIFICS
jgi:hypothetical protein